MTRFSIAHPKEIQHRPPDSQSPWRTIEHYQTARNWAGAATILIVMRVAVEVAFHFALT
jgi:hypothetical protein